MTDTRTKEFHRGNVDRTHPCPHCGSVSIDDSTVTFEYRPDEPGEEVAREKKTRCLRCGRDVER